MSSLKIQAYVRVQVAKSSPERHYFPNWNFMIIMFKFKLQDVQREEHYIPNWNFMPKTKKNDDKLFFWLELFDV